MRLGYGTYVTHPTSLVAETTTAEDVGFDAIFFSEHHGVPGYVPNPLAAATFALGASTRLRAGPMPLLLPLHDPVRIAEQAALVDALAGGRLVMGIGAGYLARDFEQSDVPLAQRGDRLEEAATILGRVWSGVVSPFAGAHHRVPALEPLTHPPHQPGGPPLWVAAGTPAGLRRAARVGDGIVIDSVRSVSEVATMAADYRRACHDAGRAPGTVAVMRRACIGDAAETAAFTEEVRSGLASYAATQSGERMPWFTAMADGVTIDAVSERVMAGSAGQVTQELIDFVGRTGVEYVIVKVRWTGGDERAVPEQITRWHEVCHSLHSSRDR